MLPATARSPVCSHERTSGALPPSSFISARTVELATTASIPGVDATASACSAVTPPGEVMMTTSDPRPARNCMPAASTTVPFTPVCTVPSARKRASGMIAAVSRREKPRLFTSASIAAALLDERVARAARRAIAPTIAGPASAAAASSRNADIAPAALPSVPGTTNGVPATTRPHARSVSAVIRRAAERSDDSAEPPRTASVGLTLVILRVASRPAISAVGNSSSSAPITGSGEITRSSPPGTTPPDTSAGMSRFAANSPGMAPSGAASANTMTTSAVTIERTWRGVAPTARRSAN